ncbi:MAG: hypothetical protein L6R36_001405 [Xanthoria steineri]|nr:MAG: hypothetical protein L6R36_001405 [Xanthoria steineri]
MTANIPFDGATLSPKKVDFCESWYTPDIKDLPVETRDLFEQYSRVPAEDVVDHIQKMRSRAWDIYPYPCIGRLRFLNLSLSRHPLYPESSGISYVHSSPQVLLDLGCCLAQDLRKLVFDGVPSEKLYGLDVEKGFIDLSYDLFNDHATFKDSSTDGLSAVSIPAPASLALLENRMSVVVANSIFHLYNYADQLRLAKRVVRLLSPERGSLILGRQVGSSQPGEYKAVNNQGTRYAHDAASFRRFWDQVAEDIGGGCKFRVETVLDEEEIGDNKDQGQNWSEPNNRRMRFGVWRE